MTSATMIQPPARFATPVTTHRRASERAFASRATTVVTGTRKFSVNSSLSASVSATNPTENASAASSSSWLWVRTTR